MPVNPDRKLKLTCPCGETLWYIDEKVVTCGNNSCDIEYSHELFAKLIQQDRAALLTEILRLYQQEGANRG